MVYENEIQSLQDMIWDFDEGGFTVGMMKGQYVYGLAEWGAVYEMAPGDTRKVTFVEGICADGKKTLPFIIINGSCILEDWVDEPQSSDEMVALSNIGYAKTHFGFQSLRELRIQIRLDLRQSYLWTLLHCSDEFKIMAHKFGILLYHFPSHAT
jgi:hypothetical protein